MGLIEIRRSTLAEPDAAHLIAALNQELAAMFPEPGATHFSLTEAQVEGEQGAFLIAYFDGEAIACGAMRRIDERTAELKRMYVKPSMRRRGVARALLGALEREARLLGLSRVVLETGTRLAAARALYESMGYSPTALFGEYLSSPNTSLCFGKSLA